MVTLMGEKGWLDLQTETPACIVYRDCIPVGTLFRDACLYRAGIPLGTIFSVTLLAVLPGVTVALPVSVVLA
jgi:hypothetical protein